MDKPTDGKDKTPSQELPRERCLNNGAVSLSLRECLALLVTGDGSDPTDEALDVAARLLDRVGTDLPEPEQSHAFFNAMESSGQAHMNEIPGMGPTPRARVLAAFELGRRYDGYRARLRRSAHLRFEPQTLPLKALSQVPWERRQDVNEWLGFVPVYSSGEVGTFCLVERGLRHTVHTDPLELFSRLLTLRPQAFYLFHNHPSGDLTPSREDLNLTREVESLSARLGIRLLGHGIVSREEDAWIGSWSKDKPTPTC